jgi:glycosyltransferase involved in cell wall biosynthesis
MASGCPVITTHHGALAEAAGDAACLISGLSVEEMCSALDRMQDAAYRQMLNEKGLAHARKFRWQKMVQTFGEEVEQLNQEARKGTYDSFFSEWKRLREIQASVDFAC